MTTIEIEPALLEQIDKLAAELQIPRAEIVHTALKRAVTKLEIEKLEKLHEEGYRRIPQDQEEIDMWIEEQVWEE